MGLLMVAQRPLREPQWRTSVQSPAIGVGQSNSLLQHNLSLGNPKNEMAPKTVDAEGSVTAQARFIFNFENWSPSAIVLTK